jgi:hypothetical protein
MFLVYDYMHFFFKTLHFLYVMVQEELMFILKVT